MDLVLDRDALSQGSRELAGWCEELRQLHSDIERSFDQLRIDWNSDAGREFFAKLESTLRSIEDHSKVVEHMSRNLTTASQRYEEVFRAADSAANAQL